MSDGGKGSRPRPFSVAQQEYDRRWDAIFSRDIQDDNTGTSKDELYDALTTEDALDELARINDELGLSIEDTYNPLIKK